MKIVSPQRELILLALEDPESLNFQFETVRFKGASTHNLV